MKICRLLTIAALICVSGIARADIITYTISATGSGTLNGSAFSDELITLSLTGDTSSVTGGAGFFSIPGTVNFTIAGSGSGTFTDSMYVFDNQGVQAVGFADYTAGGSVLDAYDSAFSAYALVTPIGPITNSPFIRPDLSYGTTDGPLNITTTGDATFTAVSGVPEPSSVILLLTVLFALALAGWNREGKTESTHPLS